MADLAVRSGAVRIDQLRVAYPAGTPRQQERMNMALILVGNRDYELEQRTRG